MNDTQNLPRVENSTDTPHYTEGDIIYAWDVGHVLKTLYGLPILVTSLIPVGLTLRNTADQTLVLRGETHEDKIRFIHLGGEGGNLSLGAWVPLSPFTAASLQARPSRPWRIVITPDDTALTDTQQDPPWAETLRAKLRARWEGRK
jgi:hypothetical protein